MSPQQQQQRGVPVDRVEFKHASVDSLSILYRDVSRPQKKLNNDLDNEQQRTPTDYIEKSIVWRVVNTWMVFACC